MKDYLDHDARSSIVFECFENKRILITGGNGYLGTNLVHLLKGTKCKIIRFARKGTRWNSVNNNRQSEVRNIEGDLDDPNSWQSLLDGTDIVFHFASQTSVYSANSNPQGDLRVNVLPMLNMLEVCRKRSIKPIILFSGAVTEAGVPDKIPVDENYPDRPITIYDLHKLISENYLKHYVREGIVRGVILRLANVYGPGPKSSSADRGILNQMIRKALKGETLTIHGTGNFIRDYVYVEDVTRAFVHAAANIGRINGKHFVIGSGTGFTVAEAFNLVAKRVERRTGREIPVTHIDPPGNLSPIEFRNFVADTSLFCSLTYWAAQVDLVRGIDLTIESYL